MVSGIVVPLAAAGPTGVGGLEGRDRGPCLFKEMCRPEEAWGWGPAPNLASQMGGTRGWS